MSDVDALFYIVHYDSFHPLKLNVKYFSSYSRHFPQNQTLITSEKSLEALIDECLYIIIFSLWYLSRSLQTTQQYFFNFLREARRLGRDSHASAAGYNVSGTSNNICHNVNSSSTPPCLCSSINCSLVETSTGTFQYLLKITTLPLDQWLCHFSSEVLSCDAGCDDHNCIVFMFGSACERRTLSSSAPPPLNSWCLSVSASGCSSPGVSSEERRRRLQRFFSSKQQVKSRRNAGRMSIYHFDCYFLSLLNTIYPEYRRLITITLLQCLTSPSAHALTFWLFISAKKSHNWTFERKRTGPYDFVIF